MPFLITSSEPVIDPFNHEELNHFSIAERIVRTPTESYFIQIYVYRFSDGSYHRALPSFLVPYKHYTSQSIESVLDMDLEIDNEDLPSDSSHYRWKLWFFSLLSAIDVILTSTDVKPADDASSLLQMLRMKHKRNISAEIDELSCEGWLPFFIQAKVSNDFEFMNSDFLL